MPGRHSKSKTHPCPVCHAVFSRKEFLDRHARTHSKEKPFSCDGCGKGYSRADVLKKHKKTCTDSPDPSGPPAESNRDPPPPQHPPLLTDDSPPDTEPRELFSYTTSSQLPSSDQAATLLLPGVDSASGVIGGSAGGFSDLDTSVEAQQLASYFRAGRVGGITPLDPVFWSQPTFTEEQFVNYGVDASWTVPREVYRPVFKRGLTLAHVRRMVQYAQLSSDALPMGLIHEHTDRFRDMDPALAISLCITGASATVDGRFFSNAMLSKKRLAVIPRIYSPTLAWSERYTAFQALLLYQVIDLNHIDELQVDGARQFHSVLVQAFLDLDVLGAIRAAQLTEVDCSHASEAMLEKEWRAWLQLEEWRRVAYTLLLTDCKVALKYNEPPLLALNDFDAHLPCAEDLWAARSATEWRSLYLKPGRPWPRSLPATLQALSTPATLEDLAISNGPTLVILELALDISERQLEASVKALSSVSSLVGNGAVAELQAGLNFVAVARSQLKGS